LELQTHDHLIPLIEAKLGAEGQRNRQAAGRRGTHRALSHVQASTMASTASRAASTDVLFPMADSALPAHASRNFYVTDLLRRGCQPHVVQALARHRDTRTTINIYAHPAPDELRAAVNRRVG
jgi:site-specific recombinase XerD